MSLTLKTWSMFLGVENLNHPEDFDIVFEGGRLVWNSRKSGTLFLKSEDGMFIAIKTKEHIKKFIQLLDQWKSVENPDIFTDCYFC